MLSPEAVLIAGPTASGKSGLAIEVAKTVEGAVVNADSMQVYDVLSVLTARPDPNNTESIEHLLYGHVHPSHGYSVAQYLADVSAVLKKLKRDGVVPVFTGGTGLYFKALLDGLSEVPPIDETLRAEIRNRIETDLAGAHEELRRMDPEGAKRIKPGDSQRVSRALEVVHSTGKPLAWWQGRTRQQPLLSAGNCLKIVLMPDRAVLRQRIAQRFGRMIEEGALDEVQVLVDLELSKDLPAMRAIGVKPLASYLGGEMALDEAIRQSVTATHQYAKRQSTWFRNQFLAQNPGDTRSGWALAGSPEAAMAMVQEFVKSAR